MERNLFTSYLQWDQCLKTETMKCNTLRSCHGSLKWWNILTGCLCLLPHTHTSSYLASLDMLRHLCVAKSISLKNINLLDSDSCAFSNTCVMSWKEIKAELCKTITGRRGASYAHWSPSGTVYSGKQPRGQGTTHLNVLWIVVRYFS